LSAEDDLTRIEGIGPKVQGILKAAGVRTYAMLSSKTSEQIAEIVKSGGFKTPFNPETWPHQASLAMAGDWDSLKKLQDELNAGRS
jgi:predicted flap endonuclease-1-like 5' DNA nuclease